MTLVKTVFVNEPHGNQEIPRNGVLGRGSCHFEAAHIFHEQNYVFCIFSNYQRVVMINDSAVKIPDDVRRNNDDVVETVKWTSKLDRVFRTNQKKDPSLRSEIVMS